MVKKDRSDIVNKTYLIKMLPWFYQKHLKSQLSLAEYLFLQILVSILQSIILPATLDEQSKIVLVLILP